MTSVLVIQPWTRNVVILFHSQCHWIIFCQTAFYSSCWKITKKQQHSENPRQSLLKCVFLLLFLSCTWSLYTDNVHSCNNKGRLWHEANKVLHEVMWMARLTSLTLVASLAAAGWGLFRGSCGGCRARLSTKLTSTQTLWGFIREQQAGGREKKKKKSDEFTENPPNSLFPPSGSTSLSLEKLESGFDSAPKLAVFFTFKSR